MDSHAQQPIRVGVVGLGWAGETHIKAYKQQPADAAVEVVALADLDAPRLERIADLYDVPQRYTDYAELIARDDLDVVSVCTPNQFHAPVAIAALESGKHVLCEKPLARTTAEGEAMVAAARGANRVLEIAFNHRTRADVQTLRRQVASGALGHVYYAKASWLRRSGIPLRGGWFMKRELAGGGPLIDLGVHVLDMTLFVLGEPEARSVSATTYAELGRGGRGGEGFQPVPQPYEVEDLATAFIRLASGATLLLETSWALFGDVADDVRLTLYGSAGGAELHAVNYNTQDALRLFGELDGAASETRVRTRGGPFHAGVVRDFLATIRSGDWADHIGLDGLRRTRIIDACYASARLGREVEIAG